MDGSRVVVGKSRGIAVVDIMIPFFLFCLGGEEGSLGVSKSQLRQCIIGDIYLLPSSGSSGIKYGILVNFFLCHKVPSG